jgi:hypothetical protein
VVEVAVLLQVGPIWGMHPLGILLLVVLFQISLCLVLVGLLRIVCFDLIEIFGLVVLRLVGPVDLINLLDIELHIVFCSHVSSLRVDYSDLRQYWHSLTHLGMISNV